MPPKKRVCQGEPSQQEKKEVPWWNGAVDNPASKMPNTMKFSEDNFDGEEYVFR
jgi:hypothetical protein